MKNKILIFLLFTFCYCSESFQELYTKGDIEKLLSDSANSDKLKIKGEQNEITILFDDKLYETYFIKLNNESYYKSPTLGNLKYLYTEFYKENNNYDEKDFFYNVLNLNTNIPLKYVEESIKNNMITGVIFNLDEKILQKYKKGGVDILIKDYAKHNDTVIILNNEIEFTLNELNTIIFYFYINGYRYNSDSSTGLQKFNLRYED